MHSFGSLSGSPHAVLELGPVGSVQMEGTGEGIIMAALYCANSRGVGVMELDTFIIMSMFRARL